MAHTIERLDAPTREALQVLGTVLRSLRAERGLSQRALAGRCGLSQSTISRLETGRAEGVRVAWIARLLAGLDTQTRSFPDERHLMDRHHGFSALRTAFDARHGDARARARELERRRNLGEVLFRHEIDQIGREGD